MIDTVADLFNELISFETAALRSQKIQHGPTIGAMYEGLTKKLLAKVIPTKLPLRVVTGFAEGADGQLSRQLDCMIVVGDGRRVPHTDSFVFPVSEVIAVIEVKKSLYHADLGEGFANLRSVAKLISGEGTKVPRIFEKAFESITLRPRPEDPKTLPIETQLLYHVLLLEAVRPARVLLGYQGFKTENSLRRAITKFAKDSIGKRGFGPGSYPNLIANQHVAAIKANGMPWGNRLEGDWWNLILTGGPATPTHALLELIWSRLNYLGMIGSEAFGEDLEIDVWHKLLAVRPKTVGAATGWEIQLFPPRAPNGSLPIRKPWSPVRLTTEQSVIVTYLCEKGSIDLQDLKDGFEDAPNLLAELRILNDLGLIGEDSSSSGKFVLLTQSCRVGIGPDGEVYAGDDMSGQFTRWLLKGMPQEK